MRVDGRFDALALYDHGRSAPTGLADAAVDVGLRVVALPEDPQDIDVATQPALAWRCPAGLAEAHLRAGDPLPLTAPDGDWLAALGPDVLGRRVEAHRAGDLAGGAPTGLAAVVSVKLATHKLRSLPVQRVSGVEQARAWAARLPQCYEVLLSEQWLALHSEYRVFTAGRSVLAASPYLVEDEPWSLELRHHRASFHDEAAAFVEELLAALPTDRVPPAMALDVARVEKRRLVVLEANSAWGAGLYGCDPASVLRSVLAANRDEPAWRWRP